MAKGVDLISCGQPRTHECASRVYEVVVRRQCGTIAVLVDGKGSIEWEDPAPLAGPGFIGLRQMLDTRASLYTHFEVLSLDA